MITAVQSAYLPSTQGYIKLSIGPKMDDVSARSLRLEENEIFMNKIFELFNKVKLMTLAECIHLNQLIHSTRLTRTQSIGTASVGRHSHSHWYGCLSSKQSFHPGVQETLLWPQFEKEVIEALTEEAEEYVAEFFANHVRYAVNKKGLQPLESDAHGTFIRVSSH